jgi:hypothetical protein
MLDLSKARPGEKFVTREGRVVTFSHYESNLAYFNREPGAPPNCYSDGKQYSSGHEHPEDIVKIVTTQSKYPTNRRAHGS